MKKNIMLRIDAQVLETAKELGLNISKYCENALVNGINALSCADTETALRRVPGVPSASWCSGRDSNPGLRLERPEYLTGLYYRSPITRSIMQNIFSFE